MTKGRLEELKTDKLVERLIKWVNDPGSDLELEQHYKDNYLQIGVTKETPPQENEFSRRI